MLKPWAIGVAVSLVLTAIVVGGASVAGVSEEWFNYLYLLCVLAGAFTGYHFLVQELDREKKH
jgi:hypothetical protein